MLRHKVYRARWNLVKINFYPIFDDFFWKTKLCSVKDLMVGMEVVQAVFIVNIAIVRINVASHYITHLLPNPPSSRSSLLAMLY